MNLEIHTYEPPVQTTLPDVLFLSGIGHTATCWDYQLPLFEEANIRVHTMNYRGHGKSQGREAIHSNRLQDYVDDLRSAVHTLQLTKRRFVLAAHSMSGYVSQVALQQADMPGLAGLILLSTLTPRLSGHPQVALKLLPFIACHTRACFRVLLSGDIRPLLASEKALRYLFFSATTPPSTVQFCRALLQSDSLRVIRDIPHAASPERGKRLGVPIQVIGAQDDHIVPVRLLRKMATVYGVQPTVFGSGHDVMLDIHYRDVAQAMIRWISELQVSPCRSNKGRDVLQLGVFLQCPPSLVLRTFSLTRTRPLPPYREHVNHTPIGIFLHVSKGLLIELVELFLRDHLKSYEHGKNRLLKRDKFL